MSTFAGGIAPLLRDYPRHPGKELEMNKTDTIQKLSEALSKAQAEFPPVPFNAVNPFLKNRYADLGGIIQTAKPILAKHGLAVSQLAEGEGNTTSVTTILMHSSGEWISSTISMDMEAEKGKSQAQAVGSVITYLRRYSLASILGLYADEDNDGNRPVSHSITPAKVTPEPVNDTVQLHEKAEITMPLDLAEAETNSKGELYVNIDTETLTHMVNTMAKMLKKPETTAEQAEEYNRKIAAARAIIASR